MALQNNELNKITKLFLNSLYGAKGGISQQSFIDECLSILNDMCISFNYAYYNYKSCGLQKDFYECCCLILNIKKVLRVLKANKINFELTAENGRFTTIKLRDGEKKIPVVHIIFIERW